MSKAPFVLNPIAAVSKIDTADWSRELWREAFAMARRMIRDGGRHGLAARWTWYLDHARRRFGASGWRLAQAAGRLVFDRRTVGFAASGGLTELERQGLVRRTRRPRPGNLVGVVAYRCATVERMRGYGFTLAWTHDELASSANKGLRVQRARQRREESRRAVARAMAEERGAMLAELEADDRLYVLTEAGLDALREAGMLD